MYHITIDDLVQMLRNSLVMYGNTPVNVQAISEDRHEKTNRFSFMVYNLVKQEHQTILSTDGSEFTPLNLRLGFVNVMGTCAYVSRLPLRRYKVGLSRENMNISVLPVKSITGADHVHEVVRTLTDKSLVAMLFNRYPSFTEAIDNVKAKKAVAVAYDKQFAVDKSGYIYYKNESVGTISLSLSHPSVNDIKFVKGKEYLLQLMEGNYEKTIRNIKAK